MFSEYKFIALSIYSLWKLRVFALIKTAGNKWVPNIYSSSIHAILIDCTESSWSQSMLLCRRPFQSTQPASFASHLYTLIHNQHCIWLSVLRWHPCTANTLFVCVHLHPWRKSISIYILRFSSFRRPGSFCGVHFI